MIQLLNSQRFMSKIRAYNAAFAFLSFSAKSDIHLSKNNIYTFRVQGIIHHRAGPLTQPDDTITKKCAQIYILDGEQQELQRMNYAEDLDIIVLKKIRLMLEQDCKNPFVLKFKTAASIYKKDPTTDLKICIHTDKSLDRRTYNKPTATEIAILIPNFLEKEEAVERKGLLLFILNNLSV